MLSGIVEEMAPVLAQMNLVILTTEDDPGFITSDHPCLCVDPRGGRRPAALNSRTIELSMTVSPNSLALFSWENLRHYQNMSALGVDEANRLRRVGCDEYFVVRRNSTKTG